MATSSYIRAKFWLTKMLGTDAQFREHQWEAVERLVERHARLLVVQRTGWGKSLVYFLATRLLRDQGCGPTLLISPLLSLMRNQIQAANALGLTAESINSTNRSAHEAIIEQLDANQIDLLLISPERLANATFQKRVWPMLKGRIGFWVIDEAHCISDWGHDFRPNYRRIVALLDDLAPDVPILCTTATANNRVIADVQATIGGHVEVLRGSLTRESLSLYALPDPLPAADRLALLAQILRGRKGSGIIYCSTTGDCLRVARWLQDCGFNVKPYYANVEREAGESRPALEDQLLHNQVKALVASVALGMGFDKPDLEFVIHFQQPGSLISYYQQIGRAGRAVTSALIVLMHGVEDNRIQRHFITDAFPKIEHVRQTIALLKKSAGKTKPALFKAVNVRPAALDKILLHLEIEGVLYRKKTRYALSEFEQEPDYSHWEDLTAQRLAELEQMHAYRTHPGCLMQFIAEALEDPGHPEPCGRCQNCRNTRIRTTPDPALLAAATTFLRHGEAITVKPRKLWPTSFPKASKKRRIENPNEIGLALCMYSDSDYGTLVQRGKYQDNRFCDELVAAAADLIREWQAKLSDPPAWVTAVPSLKRPVLVPDFARRLANALNLPYLDAVAKIARRPEQKLQENSYQQVTNLLNAFAIKEIWPDQPVLLVDDMCDSGWTLTVIGDLLQQEGSGSVYPFVLAKVNAR